MMGYIIEKEEAMYRCVIVDDDRWALADIRRSFAFPNCGVEVIGEYTDIEAAYAAIKAGRPEIVITDVCLGADNGLDLLRHCRETLPNTLVIIISGHDDFLFAQQAVNHGAFYYMLKPIERQEAERTLQRAAAHLDVSYTPCAPQAEDDVFSQILAYLQNRYSETITLEKLAEQFYINPSYLSVLFSKRTGKTFSRYRNELRVCRAQAMLDDRSTVEDAAQRAGYANTNYFCRVFKQITGHTPNEYRNKRR